MSNVVSIFTETTTLGGPVFNPTLYGFLRDTLDGFSSDMPVTKYILSDVYTRDCETLRPSPKEKVRNYRLNMNLYRKRIADMNRRFAAIFDGKKCPDHVLAIGIGSYECTKELPLDGASKELREEIQSIAKNVLGFKDSLKPMQSMFDSLNNIEKFLVLDSVSDDIEMIKKQAPTIRRTDSHMETRAYATTVSMVMKYTGIDYGAMEKALNANISQKITDMSTEIRAMLERENGTSYPDLNR
ncbi:MAG: hypothetical protein COB76_00500 [Alphaproteobacteria bacterium]|nr:MAG: hypothetical protein COB76_00500 [Alphaproteobacteria bacterium]